MTAAANGLRGRSWPRFLQGPDPRLVKELYEPALACAVRYDRCCAYFSTSVLAEAARGFGPFLARLVELGDGAPRPAVRLFVNEELSAADVDALQARGDTSALEKKLRGQLTRPQELVTRHRLEVVAWLVRQGLLEVRVGVMRQGGGIVHAKFGIVRDARGDALVFRGSGNESARGLRSNYEQFDISPSWQDPEAVEHYAHEFDTLWADEHPDVMSVPLPEAVEKKLIRLAPDEPPLEAPEGPAARQRAAMVWRFLTEAPYLEGGERAVDATAPVDPWPHQWSVIEDVSAAWPEGRLLCDEVGMGKTIEALMAIRRLLAGRGVARLLLLVPAGLLRQWQDELREKGGLLVPFFEQSTLHPPGGERKQCSLVEALKEPLLLLSRELARTETNRAVLAEAEPWDLVLLDEAHAARRAKHVEGEFNSGTLLLDLLRTLQLSGRARGVVLLSATPMQTHPWEPWDLMSVLGEGGWWLAEFDHVRRYYRSVAALGASDRPDGADARTVATLVAHDADFSPPPPHVDVTMDDVAKLASDIRRLAPSVRPDAGRWLRRGSPLSRRMHRNTRKTLREYFERGLLETAPPQRIVEDLRFDFENAAERQAYDRVKRYIETRFDLLEKERSGKGFVMTVYQRRAVSSWFALKTSLERRLEGLQAVMRKHARSEWVDEYDVLPERFFDDELPDEVSAPKISAAFPTTPGEARVEAEEIGRLLELLEKALPLDTKLERFFEALRDLVNDGRRVLVFTEYYDTLLHLRERLGAHYQERLGCYSGAGGEVFEDGAWTRVTKAEITNRLAQGRLQVLVCTDAASEGLNLQAASGLINYDLPWNPSRVEQRIGRIDRIGQASHIVRVVNLFLEDSVDDRVYNTLRRRCGLFKHFVGPMQPVLQEARKILLGRAPADTGVLERMAGEIQGDALIDAAYEEAPAKDVSTAPPPVERHDLIDALHLLTKDLGFTVREQADKGQISIRRGRKKARYFALRREVLEQDPHVRPLVLDDPELKEIPAILLQGADRLPLVIGTYEEGRYRRSAAYWIGDGSLKSVGSMRELKSWIEEWDGTAPEPEALAKARERARKDAHRLVRDAAQREQTRWRTGLEAQVQAARIRLMKELARYLVCWKGQAGDLNTVFYDAMQRSDRSAIRLRRCFKRLGQEYPEWPHEITAELSNFLSRLGPSQQDARLLGREIDAALNDPRWQAAEALRRAD